MSTHDFIVELFCRVDDAMKDVPKHAQATFWPSEIATVAILFAVKGVGERAFYRWMERDWKHLFPNLPERTRLFRLFQTHAHWSDRFLAQPTLLGVADTYGIELIHPIRAGRSKQQIGKKGLSNKRWIVGGKLGLVLNRFGRVCKWDSATANTHDKHFRPMVQAFEDQMVVLTDQGFHGKKNDPVQDPPNMKVCSKKSWNCRMLIETVLSMLTNVCHFKHARHRLWQYFHMHLGWMMAAYNLLVDWCGLQPDENGYVHLSIAPFNL